MPHAAAMKHPLLLVAVVFGVASVAALGTFYGTPRLDLSRSATDVDHVTLYQNGLAAIQLAREFEGTGGDVVLVFQFPTTTVFDSITVHGDGVTVKELRSSLSSSPVLHPGDQLVVHVQDGPRLEGTLLEQHGNQLLLATSGATSIVDMGDVSAVEVKGRAVDPAETGTTTVSILVASGTGMHGIRVSYLAQGSGWNPSYILDPGTGRMTFFATLTGMQDWENVTLDLVSGNPNLVYQPSYRTPPRASAPALDFSGMGGMQDSYEPGFTPSTSLGDLHKYHYPGTITTRQGETVRLPVATGEVEILRHYYEATAHARQASWTGLPERYELRNTLGEPLPAGPVRLYLDGAFVGADNLPALGRGESGNVTAASSSDVKARTVLVSETRGDPFDASGYRRLQHVTYVYDVQVRNLRDDGIDVRTTFEPGGHQLVSTAAVPAADRLEGTRMVWDADLGNGETASYRVTMKVEHNV